CARWRYPHWYFDVW
nr:immunoglobulin heavy chain junction region [Mus musculus]